MIECRRYSKDSGGLLYNSRSLRNRDSATVPPLVEGALCSFQHSPVRFGDMMLHSDADEEQGLLAVTAKDQDAPLTAIPRPAEQLSTHLHIERISCSCIWAEIV